MPLLRWRAQRGEAFGSRVLTSLVPSSVGFAPDADWVEAVLWISPKGARTGPETARSICLWQGDRMKPRGSFLTRTNLLALDLLELQLVFFFQGSYLLKQEILYLYIAWNNFL